MTRLFVKLAGTIGLSASGIGGVAMYFSPPIEALVSRRRNLLGLASPNQEQQSPTTAEKMAVVRDSVGLFRFGQAATAVGIVAFDYWQLRRLKRVGDADPGSDLESYQAMKKEVQQRSAERIFQLCRRLGGVYTKMGQYVATLNHVMPAVWTKTLAQLQDSAASIPLEGDLTNMIEQELGAPLTELFYEFDPVPIAAASLAQVHRAVLHSSNSSKVEVAVKVQYPHLGVQVLGDLWAMEVLAAAVGYFFEDFQYGWLLPEFEETADMELDFMQEKRNSRRMKNMLLDRMDVHVPFVIDELSSRRVLTMEFVRGVRVDDIDGMKRNGLIPLQVAETITSVFGEMIHFHGFVHCDPHPGNLLVRKAAPATHSQHKHELLLLDHGMYRRLEPSFRQAYCRLWKALLTQNSVLGTKTAKELGIGLVGYESLSLVLTFRTSTSKARMGSRMSRKERQRLREQLKDITAGDINRFMESLPRDMLFVLRTNDIIRSLNKTLGGSSRARFTSMGEWAIKGLFVPCYHVGNEKIEIMSRNDENIRYRRLDMLVDSERAKMMGVVRSSAYQSFLQVGELWALSIRLFCIDMFLWFRTLNNDGDGEKKKKPRRVLG